MEILLNIIWVTIYYLAAKAAFIGSEFDFFAWYEYGSEYTDWYRDSRQKFTPKR